MMNQFIFVSLQGLHRPIKRGYKHTSRM